MPTTAPGGFFFSEPSTPRSLYTVARQNVFPKHTMLLRVQQELTNNFFLLFSWCSLQAKLRELVVDDTVAPCPNVASEKGV
jgi:hypothetical protein